MVNQLIWFLIFLGALVAIYYSVSLILEYYLITISLLLLFSTAFSFTKVRSLAQSFLVSFHVWLQYKTDKPRKLYFRTFYNLICWLAPVPHWKTMNYGYAIDSADGLIVQMTPLCPGKVLFPALSLHG
jgi:hypothetical protein